MIDLVIVCLSLVVGILLLVIAFLTLYIIHERRKTTLTPLPKDPMLVIPLLALRTNDRSSGDHSNSATQKRITKRLRQRPPTLLIRTQNSQGFLLSSGDLSTHKILRPTINPSIDPTTIHFDCCERKQIEAM